MTSTIPHVRTGTSVPPATTKKFRADIQGLRAFAVTFVVLDHLVQWPSGGFVGVDIFFVISGFLITGHLLREWERTQRFSFVDFYRRRAKRLLPAAVTVIVVTTVTSFLLFTGSRAWSIFWDAASSLLFVGNWRFAATETDYFQADGPVSPLQHFWSLAVEEQFYFIWPWLMLAALVLSVRIKKSPVNARVISGAAILMVTLISFLWALHETATNPTTAYFSTFSRAWELGVGALLAIIAPALERIHYGVRPVLAWSGLAGMTVSVLIVNMESAFPAPAALLPVLSVALVIIAGTGGDQKLITPLTNRVSGYIGNISYSLYLWHFPVIIFFSALLPGRNASFYIGSVTTMLVFAIFAYHLIEDPLRSSNWLMKSHRTQKTMTTNRRYGDGWLAFLAVVTAGAVIWTFIPPQQNPSAAQAATAYSWDLEKTVDAAPSYGPELTDVQNNIKKATATTKWPELVPGGNSLGVSAWIEKMENTTCLDVSESNLTDCYFASPNSKKTAVLVGDSHAIAWSPGIRKALSESGYNLQMLTMQQCTAADIEVNKNDGSTYPECMKHQEWVADQIAEIKPDVVFASSAVSTLYRLASKAKGDLAQEEYADGLTRTLESIKPHTDQVVIMSTPPMGNSLEECRTAMSKPASCQTTVTGQWKTFTGTEKKVANKTGSTYVDTKLWFCSSNEICPIFSGQTLMRVDTNHLTVEYSEQLAPVIKSEVLQKLRN
ncbi:acyltransferase family protein [Kocuria sp. CCUG 69068]|uniref:acyltransferase family protein n=1 Tax=Kocuria sp. CCUG 69068 TaxID=2043138 RepID=UPI00351D1113